jgi:hypothetical protein
LRKIEPESDNVGALVIGANGALCPASQFKKRNPLEQAIKDPVQKTW